MTVFGKLLVFMNLVFSVLTGALIVFVFTNRANWKAAEEDTRKKAEAAEVAYKSERAAHDNDLKQKDAEVAAVREELRQVRQQLDGAQTEAARLQQAAATQTALTNAAATDQQKIGEELKQLKEERDALVKEKDDLRGRIVAMQKEVDNWRQTAVTADLQAKNLLQRNTNLLRSVEDLTVRVRELESTSVSVGGGTTGGGPSIVDPPPRSAAPGVRGKVTAVGSAGTNLVQINIGSDSGLSPGNVLTVFKGSEYKGDLLLTTVEAKTAVGKFTPAKRTSKAEKDDSVITSFTGSPQ
jgi:hypothetical protein